MLRGRSGMAVTGLTLVACAPLLSVRLLRLTWVQIGLVMVAVAVTLWFLRLAARDCSGLGLFSPPGLMGLAFATSVLLPLLYLDVNELAFRGLRLDYALAVLANLVIAVTCLSLVARYQRRRRPVQRHLVCDGGRLALAWCVAVIGAAIALLLLVRATGGNAEGYALALGNRRKAFAGMVWLTWGLTLPAGVSLVTTAVAVGGSKGLARQLWKPGTIVGAAFLLPIGNRTNLVAFVIATLAVIVIGRPIKLSLANQVGFVVAGFLVLSMFVGLLRSGGLEESAVVWYGPLEQFRELPNVQYVSTFGQLPAAALVAGEGKDTFLLGQTYLAALTMGIPRSIAPWKLPDVGEVVTGTLLPAVWLAGSGVQVGAAGEAIVNFGVYGTPFVGAIFGLGILRLDRLLTSRKPTSILLYAVILPRVALFYRGGFATVFALLLFDIVPVMIVARSVGLRTRTPQETRGSLPSSRRPVDSLR